MTAVAAALAVLSAVLFLWSYGVYPFLIRRLARRGRPAADDAPRKAPSVEVILSAADEEGVIAGRVENLVAASPGGAYRIAIGCDGCRDRTAETARAAAGGAPVRVVEFERRRGKAAVLNDLSRASDAEVLVFTDANTRFEPGAIERLVAALADPDVGAACGRLVFDGPPRGGETPESVLWDRETLLKEAEGALGVCLGANGAIYAARRELVEPLPEDTTSMDDFIIPIRVARGGKRVAFVGDAVAREAPARDVFAEVSRRFRIGIGGGQVLRRERWLLAAAPHPLLTLAYVSRKAARWLAPLLGLAAAAVALGAPRWRPSGAAVIALAALALGAAGLRPRLRGAFGRLYYFAVLNVALALGVAAGLLGYSRAAWARTSRS